MPQKKISQLDSLGYNNVQNSDSFEISARDSDNNRESKSITAKNLAQAIYQKISVEKVDNEYKTIQDKIEEAASNNVFSAIYLYNTEGVKYRIYINSNGELLAENPDTVDLRTTMSTYVTTFMNMPEAEDRNPSHNYEFVYLNSTDSQKEAMKQKGDAVVNYANPVLTPAPVKSVWEQKTTEFEALFYPVRFGVREPGSYDHSGEYDPEYKTSRDRINGAHDVLYGVDGTWEVPTGVSLKKILDDNPQTMPNVGTQQIPDAIDWREYLYEDYLFGNNDDVEGYINHLYNNSLEGKTSYEGTQTRTSSENMVEHANRIRDKVSEANTIFVFMCEPTGTIGYNTFMNFYSTANDYHFEVQQRQNEFVELVQNLWDNCYDAIYNLQAYLQDPTSMSADTSKFILDKISNANSNYETIQYYLEHYPHTGPDTESE